MCRIEEEQSFEELKILRELVHDRFYKQEELAEVRNPQICSILVHSECFRVDVLVLLWGTNGSQWHLPQLASIPGWLHLSFAVAESTRASAGLPRTLSWGPGCWWRQWDAAVPAVLVSWMGWLVWAAEP
jgi:hypothetical protein